MAKVRGIGVAVITSTCGGIAAFAHNLARWATPKRCCSSTIARPRRSEEHTSELQSQSNLVCRLLLEKKKKILDMRRRLRYRLILTLPYHNGPHGHICFRCFVLVLFRDFASTTVHAAF